MTRASRHQRMAWMMRLQPKGLFAWNSSRRPLLGSKESGGAYFAEGEYRLRYSRGFLGAGEAAPGRDVPTQPDSAASNRRTTSNLKCIVWCRCQLWACSGLVKHAKAVERKRIRFQVVGEAEYLSLGPSIIGSIIKMRISTTSAAGADSTG